MKTNITKTLICLGLIIGAHTASAQTFKIGGGFGYSKTNLMNGFQKESEFESFSDDTETSTVKERGILGPRLNLLATIPLGSKAQFETGIQYTNRGGSVVIDVDYNDGFESMSIDWESKTRLHYIDLPLNFNIQVYDNEQLKLYTKTGLYGSFLAFGTMKEDFRVDFGGEVMSESDSYSITDELDISERFGAGVSAGFGAEFNGIYAELSYKTGIASIGGADTDEWSMNHDFGLTVGYNLFGKK